jgi:signal peptidase II
MSEPAAADQKPVTREGLVAYGLAAAVIGLDQLAKYWILAIYDLPDRGSVAVLPFFSLSMVRNRGVSFGLLRADQDLARWGLAAFSVSLRFAGHFDGIDQTRAPRVETMATASNPIY